MSDALGKRVIDTLSSFGIVLCASPIEEIFCEKVIKQAKFFPAGKVPVRHANDYGETENIARLVIKTKRETLIHHPPYKESSREMCIRVAYSPLTPRNPSNCMVVQSVESVVFTADTRVEASSTHSFAGGQATQLWDSLLDIFREHIENIPSPRE